jgi:hypothetical protein
MVSYLRLLSMEKKVKSRGRDYLFASIPLWGLLPGQAHKEDTPALGVPSQLLKVASSDCGISAFASIPL